MSSLTFIFGPVSSGKTIQLITQAHQIRQIHGKNYIKLMKPGFDTRYGYNKIKSASGLEIEADFIINNNDSIAKLNIESHSYLLVDEIQFFTVGQIYELHKLSIEKDVHIECFGLLKDFRNNLFQASAKLLELADKIVPVFAFCFLCSKHKLDCNQKNATYNMKIISNGDKIVPTIDGASKECGGIEKYIPVCSKCYYIAFKSIEVQSCDHS